MTPRKVVFYLECSSKKEYYEKNVGERGIQQRILTHLRAEEVEFLTPGSTSGFYSGISWVGQRNLGMFAIVLLDFKGSTIFGILNEVSGLDVKVYGVLEGLLHCFSDIDNISLPEGKDISKL